MARTVSVILEARVDGYKASMKDAETATKKLADTAKDAGKSVDEAGPAGSRAGKALGKAAEYATKKWERLNEVAQEAEWDQVADGLGKVGVAAMAGVGLAIREYANFDEAMAGVAATGSEAKASLDQLRAAAKKAGAETAFSAVEAANGIEELSRAGVSVQDVLGGGLDGALSLAAAGQIEVADAAAIASTAMTQFKLSGEQVPHIADLLAAGAGKAMGGVDDLGAALKQSGLVASQFGLSIEETVGGLSAFAAAGLLGSDAGTSLKSMLLALANPAGATAKKMQELGINAYDAQGKFIGLEGLAGMLQERLGHLDDAQRQQALSQIFGNDAIRAASILYENGADGIAAWTDAVNEAGYAAQTAADYQNNLKGDLEKLGGSLSTWAINAGEVADGPLRGLVQAVTALVDALAESPAATTGLLTVTAALGGLALTAAGIMKATTAWASFQVALDTLSAAHPKINMAAGAVGKLGKAATKTAIAFAAMQAAGMVIDKFATHARGLDDTAAALERVASGASSLSTLDKSFRDAADSSRELAGGVGSLSTALEFVGALQGQAGVAYAMESFVVGLFGLEGQADKVKQVFADMDATIKNMSMSDQIATFSQLAAEAERVGTPVEALVELMPGYARQVEALAEVNGLGELSQKDLAAAMAGTYEPLMAVQDGMSTVSSEAAAAGGAFDQAAADAEALQQAADAQAETMMEAVSAYKAAEDAIRSLNDAQREAANLWMSEQAAADQYIATLQAVGDQIAKNGTSLDANTEQGRANREFLRGLATDARDVTDAMLANGAGVDVVNAKMAEQRTAIIGVLGQFGIVAGEAEAYADSLGLIPNYVETLVATPGAKLSQQEAEALNAELEGLPDEVKAEIITKAQREGYDAALNMLNSIAGKTVTTFIDVVKRTVGGSSAPVGGRTVMKASGGAVFGPGTSTSDSIPAWLSDGEFVIRAWAARAIGYDRLGYMNATGRMPRFADGGRVSPYATAGTLSGTTTVGQTTITNIYNLEGREAMSFVISHTRDARRTTYQTEGVH